MNKVERMYIQKQQQNQLQLQPEYVFCRHNKLGNGQAQDWYPNENVVVVPIYLNGRCCF